MDDAIYALYEPSESFLVLFLLEGFQFSPPLDRFCRLHKGKKLSSAIFQENIRDRSRSFKRNLFILSLLKVFASSSSKGKNGSWE